MQANAADAALCPHSGGSEAPNALSESEREAGWTLLFSGDGLDGWRGYQQDEAPAAWQATDGTLHFTPGQDEGGDLVTTDTYGDFVLSLDWRITEGGNSGIFYRATETNDRIWETAPEVQLLDNEGHPDSQDPTHRVGALYDLYAPSTDATRPPGEWNRTCISVEDDHVEHWINGERVVSADIGSDEWDERFAESKFSEWEDFAQAERGRIGLQDHGNEAWFRNIKIRPLD